MRPALLIICLISTLSLSAARNPHHRKPFEESWSAAESKVENGSSDGPVRLSRKYITGDTSVKRLHVKNQTALDGKVRNIHFEREEEQPGIRAYGLPKKSLEDSGFIERIPIMANRFSDDPRNGRLVEAYGMSKDRLENNGEFERVIPSVLLKDTELKHTGDRRIRSIGTETENANGEKDDTELNDLEAQDAKVFRPLFVYRQQVAERERRNRARHQVHGQYHSTDHKRCDNHQHFY